MSLKPLLFSIIIPTYNRPQQLTHCLTALAEQDFSTQRFEVIIVNDGGDSLEDVVESFKGRLAIALIYQQNTGPAQARNQGATLAKGDFLAFTDDDCCPSADWLSQLAKQCQATPEVLIGGQTLNSLPQNFCSTASQLTVELAYQYFNPSPHEARFFASNNMVFPRQHFLKLGGFHAEFRTSEDREICDRWLLSGRTMIYVSAVKIHHTHRLSLSDFWQQHLGYGRGAYCYHTIRSKRGSPPFRPDFSFHRRLFTYPFQQFAAPKAVAISGLMCLAQLASLVGYFLEKNRSSQTLDRLYKELVPLTSMLGHS
ncbi:MAG: glycosyltransferase [Phormidesmis sp.]